MATVSSILTSLRYDLRDTAKTQYADAELLDYLNRVVEQLDNVLASLKSDWVITNTSLTLSSGDNSVSLPADFLLDISLWYGTNQIDKNSVTEILEYQQKYDTTGRPTEYAIQSSNIIFNYTADQDYSLDFIYIKKTGTLSTSDDMPYNDYFNEVIRKGVVLYAKSRNEYDVNADAFIYNEVRSLELMNARARKNTFSRVKPYK